MVKIQFKFNSTILLVFISFFIGFFIQKIVFISKDPKPVTTENTINTDCKKSNPKLSEVSAEEIREYLRTQNADEKLKKADDLLSKIVLALIADIGLRMNHSDLEQFGKGIPQATNSQILSKTEVSSKAQAEATQALELKNKSAKEAINAATTDEQARKAIDSIQTNFSERLKYSHNVDGEKLNSLNGNYEGELFLEKVSGPHHIVFNFQGHSRGNKSTGKYWLEIFYPSGKRMSYIKSGTKLDRFSESDDSIFIDVVGNYIEIFYFPKLDTWYGQYLEMQKGVLQKTGVLSLKRAR